MKVIVKKKKTRIQKVKSNPKTDFSLSPIKFGRGLKAKYFFTSNYALSMLYRNF